MEPVIYILLPVHNRKEITLGLILCFEKQNYRNFKLIVIDDGSTDGTAQSIKEIFPDSVVITGKGDWWWAGSLQQGYHWISENANADDIVLIINDDSFIERDFLKLAVGILNENSHTLLLAQAFGLQTGDLVDRGVVFDFRRFKIRMADNPDEINCMSTRGLFMRAKDMLEIKGFRSKLLPHYYSDYEFTIRAHRKGFKLMVCDDLKLWMNENTTGIGFIKKGKKIDFLRDYFSKKYTDNPIYTINFILLTFPFPYNIKFSVRQLRLAITTLIKLMLGIKALN